MIRNRKKADFYIKSKYDENEIDRVNNLSFGEKNIIGLILFLMANRDNKYIVIDDPASSFDEYRRKVLFDMIYKTKSKESTVLVLSHDHVFAKFASYHYEKSMKNKNNSAIDKLYMNYTGKIDFIETFDTNRIMPINANDFDSMTNFIKNRINELPKEINYQTATNLRLFYEINKAKKYQKEVYGYLSQIIHKIPKSTICESLNKYEKGEEDILDIINEQFDTKFLPLSNNYLDSINISEFNQFEKIIYVRELCKSKSQKQKVIKDELSNIIHMNMAYAICLNPYKFNYFSKYVFEYIKIMAI